MGRAELLTVLQTFEVAQDWTLADFIAGMMVVTDSVPPKIALRRAEQCLERLAWELTDNRAL